MGLFVFVLALGCAFKCQTPQFQVAYTHAGLAFEELHVDMNRDNARFNTRLPSGFLLSGHETVAGKGMVLQMKEINKGRRGRSDSSYFEMLSIYLPYSELCAGQSVDLGNKDVGAISYYSTANYGFLDKGGCHGYATSGKLVIDTISDTEIRAAIEVSFDLVDPSGFVGQCASTNISRKFVFFQQEADLAPDAPGAQISRDVPSTRSLGRP